MNLYPNHALLLMRYFLLLLIILLTLFISFPLLSATPHLHGQNAKDNCSQCHGWRPSNPKPRPLKKPHNQWKFTYNHGNQKFWCMQCHPPDDLSQLKTTKEPVPFSLSYKNCQPCHGKKTAEFLRGVHGKRTTSWRGERHIERCPSCHNPHNPKIEKFSPYTPPWLQK
ncbi:hypothetical protein ACQZV8_03015 [Magnetococcales bacterium HHB-1]